MNLQKISLMLITVPVLLGTISCKIVKHTAADAEKEAEEKNAISFSDSDFNPKQYAADIWDAKVLPRIIDTAVELKDLITGLKTDETGTCDKYGYRVGDEGTFYNFAVKGKIKVLAVNTETRNGTMDADVEPFDGTKDITVQIGPVFRGSAIRDYLDFISINSFQNQVEFAKLGTEFNLRVRDTVVKDVDFASLVGKECTLTGVITYDNGIDNLVVIPVKFTGPEK